MKSSSKLVALAALLALVPACSVLFDGSSYRGGADVDGGHEGDGGAGDGGARDGDVPVGDAGPIPCTGAAMCPAGFACEESFCTDCDVDGDGFAVMGVTCMGVFPARPRDCNDGNDAIYPGALPICRNMIDESCSGGSIAGGLATEAGVFPRVDVTLPPGVDRATRLRAFSLPADRAMIFFAAGDSDRTPHVAVLDLGGSDVTSMDLGTAGGVTLPGGTVRSDAIRVGPEQILVGAIATTVSTSTSVHAVFDGLVGDWTLRGSGSHDFVALGAAGFQVSGPAALVARGSSYFFALAARTTSQPDPALFALGADSTDFQMVGAAGGILGTSPWLESAGPAVAYPDASGNVRFWAGATGTEPIDLTFQANATTIPGGAAAPLAVVDVRGDEIMNRLAFVAGTSDTIGAFTTGCSNASTPLDGCTDFAGQSRSYPTEVGSPPLVAAARLSPTTLLIVYPVASMDGSQELAIALLETTELSTSLLRLPARLPIDGELLGLAIDSRLEQGPTDDGSFTYTLAMLTERDGGTNRGLNTFGARVCIGPGGV